MKLRRPSGLVGLLSVIAQIASLNPDSMCFDADDPKVQGQNDN
jgi:hypothetical protein